MPLKPIFNVELCGKHYHIPRNPEDVEAIRKMIEQIEYEGWIPKSVVEVFEEVGI